MRRILELDALRGVFAVLIVLAHVGLMPDSRWVFSTVDLFFVLSGYFITANVLKNRDAPGFLRVFFTRRALRIWPAYYVALAACLILNRKLKWDAPPDAWPFYLTFTQNVHDYLKWPSPRFSGMFLHTWTLAIEEQFYLVWPLLLCRAGRREVAAAIAAFAVGPPVLRALGYSPYLLLTRADGLAMGGLLAVLLRDGDRVARRLGAYRVGFAAVGLAALVVPEAAGRWVRLGFGGGPLGPALFTTRACLVYFGLAGLVLCLRGHPALGVLRARALCYVGTVSYGLYLYHPLVFGVLPVPYARYVTRRLGVSNVLVKDLVMVAVCFALAELSRRWLEGPILAWKERLTYRRPDPVYQGPHRAPAREGAGDRVGGAG